MSAFWSMFWFKPFRNFLRKITIFRNFDQWSEILSMSDGRPLSQGVCPSLLYISNKPFMNSYCRNFSFRFSKNPKSCQKKKTTNEQLTIKKSLTRSSKPRRTEQIGQREVRTNMKKINKTFMNKNAFVSI
jgi:hypothetical protein